MPSLYGDYGGVETRPKFECPRHGKMWHGLQLTYVNLQGEIVFNRVYCLICLDSFFQRYLEPMREGERYIKEEDEKNA